MCFSHNIANNVRENNNHGWLFTQCEGSPLECVGDGRRHLKLLVLTELTLMGGILKGHFG